MSQPETIVQLLADRLKASADLPALWTKSNDTWTSRTWNEVGSDILRIACWLVDEGIKPGDRVSQLSENRYEWLVVDLALHVVGAVHVPIHASLTGSQAAFQIRDSDSKLVLLSTSEQVAKLEVVASELPADVKCCSYETSQTKIGDSACIDFWESVSACDAKSGQELFDAAVARTTGTTLATILYTSGTTGEPKGVMLSNHNITSNTLAVVEPFEQGPNDVRLAFLPLSHIFARTCDLYTWVASGSQLALAESRETVIADCAAVRPTLLNAVPYFFEKIAGALASVNFDEAPTALKDLLGGRIRLCCSGGAALPDAVFDFFVRGDVPLLQGYGLTESSPVITLSSEQHVRRGSVGRAIPDVEIETADDGEILTRGPHVMLGYFKNDVATDEVIRGGWLYTGDIGHLDEDGFLFITGRKKELIVTSGGKNIAPVYIESLLTQDPLIAQAVVIGDGRKYLSALIVPDQVQLNSEMAEQGVDVSNEELLRSNAVKQLFEQRISERLSLVSHYEQIRKFTLLDNPFTLESGELTPKLTLRRETIFAKCRDAIEAMYDDA